MSWTIESLTELATAYWKSGVLSAAVEIGLFDAIGAKGSTAAEAAEKLACAPRHTEELLDALCAMDLLEKRNDSERACPCYRLRPSASQFLTRNGLQCILDALRYNTDLYPLWGRLAECVREGQPVLRGGDHLGGDPARTRRFVLGMHSRALPMAPALLPAIDLQGRARLLDLASGPGTFSALLADRHAGLQVTLFDLPPILDVARELIAPRSAAPRFAYQPGDYRRDELPRGFDAVLFCGALHQESTESAAHLLKKVYRALEPGGRLFVVDMMLQADRTAPLFSNLFSINMMLTSPAGRVFSDEELRNLLHEVGFDGTGCRRLTGSPYTLVTGDRPAARSGARRP